MGCFLSILGFFFPRLVIVLLALGSDYLGRAYHTFLWPLLGFFFLPFTTLAYAAAMNEHGSVSGPWLLLVVLGVLLDLGVIGQGSRHRRRLRACGNRS